MDSIKANGAEIPSIGLGTWTLTGSHCRDMVAKALDTGWRHIDTAAMYGNETEVGEGIRASGVDRSEIFLTTKVWWTDLDTKGFRRSAERSVEALGPVDLLLIHWPNPAIPLAETIEALNRAKADGLTRHIGVSNFTTGLLAQAIALTEAPLVANQVENHPYLDQRKVHAACRAAGMALVSYVPLHRGGPLFSEAAVTEAARRHGRSPAQIVLRWHVQQDGIAAIPRTSKPERLAENLDVFSFSLDADEMQAISALRGKGSRACDYDFSPEWDAA